MSHSLKTGPGSECRTIRAKVAKRKSFRNIHRFNTRSDYFDAESPDDDIHRLRLIRIKAKCTKPFRSSNHVLSMEGRKPKLGDGIGRGMSSIRWSIDLAAFAAAIGLRKG